MSAPKKQARVWSLIAHVDTYPSLLSTIREIFIFRMHPLKSSSSVHGNFVRTGVAFWGACLILGCGTQLMHFWGDLGAVIASKSSSLVHLWFRILRSPPSPANGLVPPKNRTKTSSAFWGWKRNMPVSPPLEKPCVPLPGLGHGPFSPSSPCLL